MEAPSALEQFASAAAVEAYLSETAIQQYATLFGQPSYGYYPYAFHSSGGLKTSATGSKRSSNAAYTTNVQVAGVDEADLVETDGEFLYQVNGQTLTILDVRDPGELEIATQVTITPPWEIAAPQTQDKAAGAGIAALPVEPSVPIGGPVGGWNRINGMYLQGDRLTVISTGWSPGLPFTASNLASNAAATQAANSAYASGMLPGLPQVQVTVLDVADPNRVSLVETSLLEGNLVSSRAIGDEVVVVTSQGFQLPRPLVIEDVTPDGQLSEGQGAAATAGIAPAGSRRIWPYPRQPKGTYETEAAYLARIEDQILDLGLANVETRNGQGQVVDSGLITEPQDIYKPVSDESWQQLTTVSTFDVGDHHLGIDESVALATPWIQEVFVSQDYLYLLRSTYQAGSATTQISQLDLETSKLLAVGEVPGRIDNQFSVDEQDGFLRISTTTNWGAASSNNVYVLDQVDTRLEVVGKVEGLAPGERIYSTRFQGDYGFVVTFRQVDPLFVLDLRDPQKPEVVGELKIPGFSEYLQVIQQGEQTLLLGIGRDADPVTGRAQALKVSLFDVTDVANPVEVDNYIFEGQYSSSEALWDHKAVTYLPEQQLLAIPSQTYEPGIWEAKNQLTVFKVDGQRGIDRIGEVEHRSGWRERINRSLMIDGDLLAVSGEQVSVYDLPGLELRDALNWDVEQATIPPLSWAALPDFEQVARTVFAAERSGVTLVDDSGDGSLWGTQDDDALDGGAGDDRLYGNGGQNIVLGDAGEDEIYGGNGGDVAFGGEGDDLIYGNEGRDVLVGDGGEDKIWAGRGDDVIAGGAGDDVLWGGLGRDRFLLRSGDGRDRIEDFQAGVDQIGLFDGDLTWEQLSITQTESHTTLGVASTGEVLALLRYTQADRLGAVDFAIVPDLSNLDQAMALL